jgi:hypothetical protein
MLAAHLRESQLLSLAYEAIVVCLVPTHEVAMQTMQGEQCKVWARTSTCRYVIHCAATRVQQHHRALACKYERALTLSLQ